VIRVRPSYLWNISFRLDALMWNESEMFSAHNDDTYLHIGKSINVSSCMAFDARSGSFICTLLSMTILNAQLKRSLVSICVHNADEWEACHFASELLSIVPHFRESPLNEYCNFLVGTVYVDPYLRHSV